jgi:hypothetical protein
MEKKEDTGYVNKIHYMNGNIILFFSKNLFKFNKDLKLLY